MKVVHKPSPQVIKHELKKADEKYRIVPKAIQQAMAEAKAEGISVGYEQVHTEMRHSKKPRQSVPKK